MWGEAYHDVSAEETNMLPGDWRFTAAQQNRGGRFRTAPQLRLAARKQGAYDQDMSLVSASLGSSARHPYFGAGNL